MKYHEILGVKPGATSDEIKRAYRKLAHQHHPDKPTGNAEKFKEVNEAYKYLTEHPEEPIRGPSFEGTYYEEARAAPNDFADYIRKYYTHGDWTVKKKRADFNDSVDDMVVTRAEQDIEAIYNKLTSSQKLKLIIRRKFKGYG